jgi:mannose-6-phosphate isomerase-like protein (cupin superfamily)
MINETSTTKQYLEPVVDLFLPFGTSFDIAEGVVVQPIEYPAGRFQPPFKSTVFVVAPGCSSPMDRHEVAEMWVILSGTGLLECDGRKINVSRSDKLFFPSLRSHQVTNDATVPLEILSVYWSVK